MAILPYRLFPKKGGDLLDDHELPPGTYLIPRPITRGFQVVPGIGVKDAAFAVAGLALGLVLWLTLHAFGVPFLFRALTAVLPALLGGVCAIPLDDQHIWEFARDFLAFRQKPKTLYYDWQRNDW